MSKTCKYFFEGPSGDYSACLYDGQPCKYNGDKKQCDEDNPIDPLHKIFLELQESVDENSFKDILPD